MMNSAIKRYTMYYMITVLCGTVVFFFAVRYASGRLNAAYVQVFSEVLAGDKDMLSLRGYEDLQMMDYQSLIRSRTLQLYGIAFGVYGVLAVVGYMAGLLLYRSALLVIRQAKQVSDAVLAEQSDRDPSQLMLQADRAQAEGEIGAFWDAYDKMVTAIAQAREDEKKEKIFLQELIADISHQLKTPLATLTIYQDLLLDETLSVAARRDMLSKMGDQLTRMEWLILNLLKLARLEAGSIRFAPQAQPMLPTLQFAYENVRVLEEAKHQQIRICCPETLLVVHDREWTVEAFTNIMKNATEYAPRDSVIEVTVEQSAVMTEVHFKDYGIGIAPEDIHKVFRRFYRAKLKVNENSIGIGLSLAKSIITGQGGEITVESEPGAWTCFTVTFSR